MADVAWVCPSGLRPEAEVPQTMVRDGLRGRRTSLDETAGFVPPGPSTSAGAQCVPRNPPAWDARPRSSGLDALTGIGEAGTQSRVLPLPVGETAFPQEIPTASVPCGRTPCTQGPLMPAGDVRLRRASSCPVGLPGRRRRLRADRDPVATVDRPPAPRDRRLRRRASAPMGEDGGGGLQENHPAVISHVTHRPTMTAPDSMPGGTRLALGICGARSRVAGAPEGSRPGRCVISCCRDPSG
jgi:hypothetical protein